MKNLQMVEIDHNRFAAVVDNGNVSINLTEMAKPFKKRPVEWLRTDEAKTYLNMLESKVQKCTLGYTPLITVLKGGRVEEAGTWAHDCRIAMRFAQWLSPEFAIKVDEVMLNLFANKNQQYIINRKVHYNYIECLEKHGFSVTSTYVYRRMLKFPDEFAKVNGKVYCSKWMAEYMRKNSENRHQNVIAYHSPKQLTIWGA